LLVDDCWGPSGSQPLKEGMTEVFPTGLGAGPGEGTRTCIFLEDPSSSQMHLREEGSQSIHGTARHGTARHGTARHGTARRITTTAPVTTSMQSNHSLSALNKLRGLQPARELYRLIDRHLSTKFSVNLWIEGCGVISAEDPPRSLICFLDRSRYFSFK
jgi:hypothetical protein